MTSPNEPKTYEDGIFDTLKRVRELLEEFKDEHPLLYPITNELSGRLIRLEAAEVKAAFARRERRRDDADRP